MKDTHLGRRFRRSALFAGSIGSLVAALVACSTPAAACSDFTLAEDEVPEDEAMPATVVLLDVSDNGAGTAKAIATDVGPEIRRAVTEGERLVVMTYGGTGESVDIVDCFEPGVIYQVKNANKQRQEAERNAAVDHMSQRLEDAVRSTTVAEDGTARALIDRARATVADLVSGYGTNPDEIQVILRSDLLGTGSTEDCLNLDGHEVLPEVADQLVQRCIDVGQITPFPDGVRFSVKRANEDGSAAVRLAGLVEDALCAKLSTECSS